MKKWLRYEFVKWNGKNEKYKYGQFLVIFLKEIMKVAEKNHLYQELPGESISCGYGVLQGGVLKRTPKNRWKQPFLGIFSKKKKIAEGGWKKVISIEKRPRNSFLVVSES